MEEDSYCCSASLAHMLFSGTVNGRIVEWEVQGFNVEQPARGRTDAAVQATS